MKRTAYWAAAFATLGALALLPMAPTSADATAPAAGRRVRAQGRLEPAGGVYRVGLVTGARVATLHVSEGAWVQKGTLLITLEGDSERQTEVELIETQLSEISAKLAAEEEYQKLLLEEWALQRRRADDVEKLELPQQTESVRRLQEAVAIGDRQLQRLRGLHKAGSVASDQVEKQELEIRKARSELDQATQALEKLRRNVDIAKDELRLQRAKILATTNRLKAAMPVSTLQTQRRLAIAKVDAGRIKAPVDGRILRLLVRPGETIAATPVIQMGDTKHMFASAEIDEADVSSVQPGQKAIVKMLGQTLPGVVSSVGLLVAKNELTALDPTSRSDARVVEVKVKLDSSDVAGRYTNLQVDVEIETQAAP